MRISAHEQETVPRECQEPPIPLREVD
jgi:hypothetical protein